MNWLAHVFLSPPAIEYQLGNLLADTTKGRCWPHAHPDICHGMALHQAIDTFTDAHPEVRESKRLLASKGALKGVVLDVLYDHFLSLHWARYCKIDRERFLRRFRARALKTCHTFPPDARHVVKRVVASRQLQSYASMEGVKRAFMRIDNRLSARLRQKDGMMAYLSLIGYHRDALEAAFLHFFPDLMAHVAAMETNADFTHWKT